MKIPTKLDLLILWLRGVWLEAIIVIIFIFITTVVYNYNETDTRTEEHKCIQEYSNTTLRNTPNYCIKYFK